MPESNYKATSEYFTFPLRLAALVYEYISYYRASWNYSNGSGPRGIRRAEQSAFWVATMINIDKIDTQDKFDDLKEFAASFDHLIDDHSITPIYTLSRHGNRFGYLQIILKPVIVPSFHTNNKICHPRDFFEAVIEVKQKVMQSTVDERFPEGTLLVLLPPDIGEKYKGALKKLKLNNLGSVMYQSNEKRLLPHHRQRARAQATMSLPIRKGLHSQSSVLNPTCPICQADLFNEHCKLVCRSPICINRIIENCNEH
jgi:hypothetical protein